jgi:hypothetical protein
MTESRTRIVCECVCESESGTSRGRNGSSFRESLQNPDLRVSHHSLVSVCTLLFRPNKEQLQAGTGM